MERLTQWYDDGKIRGVLVKDGYEENALQTIVTKIDECYAAVALLKEYEDTGLTPPEIMELKERDTAKLPIDIEDNYDRCHEMDYEVDEAYIKPKRDIAKPISEVIAWSPLLESYHPERSVH